jgi:hypothetical protein
MQTMPINFTQDELKIIDQALQQIPYYAAKPIIDNINKQIQDFIEASK